MADDIDRMLQGDDATPASQAPTGQQDDGTQQVPQQTEEEVAFNNLSGSAQDRVRELVRRAKEAEELAQQRQVPQQFPTQQQLAPEQEQALQTLSKYGVTTDEKLQREISGVKNEVLWELQKQRLMQQYDGSNGLPKYDPTDVEDYVSRHPEYAGTPRELVFKSVMYPDEFAAGKTQPTRQKQTSFRPAKTYTQGSAITPDNVEDMIKSHDEAWFDEHQSEINAAVKAHTQQFKDVNFGGQ